MTADAGKRQRGHFWMNSQKGGKKRYRVVVEQRPQVGDEIIVRRKDGSHNTVVVTPATMPGGQIEALPKRSKGAARNAGPRVQVVRCFVRTCATCAASGT